MRQTCKKIKVDAEYRWFLGILFGIDTPHFSTFSKNYERRFKDSDIFEEIFIKIVNQAIKYNLVDVIVVKKQFGLTRLVIILHVFSGVKNTL